MFCNYKNMFARRIYVKQVGPRWYYISSIVYFEADTNFRFAQWFLRYKANPAISMGRVVLIDTRRFEVSAVWVLLPDPWIKDPTKGSRSRAFRVS